MLRYAFLALALVFLLVWISAFIILHVAGPLVHILLVGAVILFLVYLLQVAGQPLPAAMFKR